PGDLSLEAVADPRLVDDVTGVGRVVAELLANLGDHVAGVVLVSDRIRAPHLAQQGAVRDRLPGVQGEKPEQLVLGRSQMHSPTFDADRSASEVDLQV